MQVPKTEIKQLIAPVPRPPTPRCEAEKTTHDNWRTRGSNLCAQSSSYVINGKHLCGQHAGKEALRLLLEANNGT